jgi:LuxR family maltose regulon positive regulatory protein
MTPTIFAAPTDRAGQIERTRLLADGDPFRSRRVMAVVAPAGYGKTTFVAQWCSRDKRAVAWLGMTDADNDPVRLLYRIAQGLEARERVDPGLTDALDCGSRFDASLARLVDSMAQRSPVLLVIDDVHLLQRTAALDVLGALARAMPDGSQLVLISRTEPQLPLARLRVAADLHEVEAVDLALDERETAELLEQAGLNIAADEVARVWAQTEGWPAAVALVAMAQHEGPLVALTGRDRHLADYFAEEVLSRESDDRRRFLLETSVTRRLSAPLCDAITGRADSARRLRELASSNLFLVPLDEHREWYRYHHLFQELLQVELDRSEDDPAQLLDRAAAWHEAYGDPAEAFEYASRAGNFTRAGRVLAAHYREYASRGRLETLLLLLDHCQEEDIESDPQLAVAAAWITGELGDAERANRYLAAASRHDLDGPSAEGWSSIGAALRNVRASVGPLGASQMRDDALSLVGSELPGRTPRLVGAYRSLGVAEQLLGNHEAAIAALDEALLLTGANPVLRYVGVWCLGHLALAHADLGRWNRAETCTSDAEAAMGDLEGRVQTVPVLAARATIQATAGDRPAVMVTLARAFAAIETTAAGPCIRAHLACRFAEAAQMIGADDVARDLLRESRTACARAGDAGVIPDRLDRLELNMLRVDPRLGALTPAERRVLDQLATHRTQQEIANHLFISRATVKTHVAAIYSKLGVSSRDEAVTMLGAERLGPAASSELPASR